MKKLLLIAFIFLCSCKPTFEEEIEVAIFNAMSQKCLEQGWEDYGQIEKIYKYFKPMGAIDLSINESKRIGAQFSNTEVTIYDCSFTFLIQSKDGYMEKYPGSAIVAKKRDAPFFVMEYKVDYEFDI